MAKRGTILVGTIGQGVMMSPDDGESWTRASVRNGMHSDCIVKALLADSRHSGVVYAGADRVSTRVMTAVRSGACGTLR